MVQFALIFILIVAVLLFVFSLKLHFMLTEVSFKLEELDSRLVKAEKEIYDLKAKVDRLESSLKMALKRLKG